MKISVKTLRQYIDFIDHHADNIHNPSAEWLFDGMPDDREVETNLSEKGLQCLMDGEPMQFIIYLKQTYTAVANGRQ